MKKLNKIRLPLDIMMTLVSIVLMGGNFLFPADLVHEILGVALFVLWGVHIFLNHRWYASLAQASKSITSTNANDRRAYGAIFRGNYNPYRVMQTIINCCILICYNLTFNSIKIKEESINQKDQIAITINFRYTGKIMQLRSFPAIKVL